MGSFVSSLNNKSRFGRKWDISLFAPILKIEFKGSSQLSVFSTEKPAAFRCEADLKRVLFKVRSRPSMKYCAADRVILYCAFIAEMKKRTGVPEEPDVACFDVAWVPFSSRLPSVSTCLTTSPRVRMGRSVRFMFFMFFVPI